jgi:hypothetical protein
MIRLIFFSALALVYRMCSFQVILESKINPTEDAVLFHLLSFYPYVDCWIFENPCFRLFGDLMHCLLYSVFTIVLTCLWLARIIQSSSYPIILTGSCILSHISDIAMRNNVTPNTTPCTTPFSTTASFESVFPTATLSTKFSMNFRLSSSFFDDLPIPPAHVIAFGYIQESIVVIDFFF